MIEFLKFALDFILHIDVHLKEIVSQYDTWTYLILFCIIFCETGLVVTPFLPGDSLLFAAGALAAGAGAPLSIFTLITVLMIAAIAGDNSNYFIGRFLGHKIYEKNFRLIKREYIDKTHKFYEKHGGKTVVIARFMPILRTFAPFVAGIGEMKYLRFFLFSIGGTILWVNTFCWAGYLFANNSFVQKNFTIVVFAIIAISLIPPVLTVVKQWLGKRKNK
ncbi:MAG TPA: DedA family protein [Bacteroidales bacterium]|nr:DedA family protein [Bacteroidales bacterium]